MLFNIMTLLLLRTGQVQEIFFKRQPQWYNFSFVLMLNFLTGLIVNIS